MPRSVYLALSLLLALSLVPFACIAAARSRATTSPRIHLVPDMDNQKRFKSQQRNALFADGREERPPVEGTVARGRLDDDPALYRGKAGDAWVTSIPVPVTSSLMKRGQERYGIYCAPCHGLAGYGDGIVGKRADRLQEGTWVPPLSYHTDTVRKRTDGELFNTITNGIRNMPAYGPQIPVADRWAIVAYVRALQRSQNSTIEDVPPAERAGIR